LELLARLREHRRLDVELRARHYVQPREPARQHRLDRRLHVLHRTRLHRLADTRSEIVEHRAVEFEHASPRAKATSLSIRGGGCFIARDRCGIRTESVPDTLRKPRLR